MIVIEIVILFMILKNKDSILFSESDDSNSSEFKPHCDSDLYVDSDSNDSDDSDSDDSDEFNHYRFDSDEYPTDTMNHSRMAMIRDAENTDERFNLLKDSSASSDDGSSSELKIFGEDLEKPYMMDHLIWIQSLQILLQ